MYILHPLKVLLYRELYKTHHGMTNTKHVVLITGAPIRYMCNDIPYVHVIDHHSDV